MNQYSSRTLNKIIILTIIVWVNLVGASYYWNYSQMKKQAVIDSLTGIPNRRHFNEKIKKEFSRSQRHMESITLLMCDIDNFKLYNDTYGHKAGDDCLLQVARTLNTSIRRPNDFCARYGGEEFVVILPETNTKGALPVAKSILKNTIALGIDHSENFPLHLVTMSIGAATTLATPETTHEDLIKAADKALYRAKRGGKNCVEQVEEI